MALFLFKRLSIVFIQLILILIGFNLRNGKTLLTTDAFVVNVKVPGPQINITIPPPYNIIISKNRSPILIPCTISINDVIIDNIYEYSLDFLSWYRNDDKIRLNRRNDYQILRNGTLKLFYNDRTLGNYHCLANGTEIGVGAILSTQCTVQNAVWKRYPSVSNITIGIGLPIIINCPLFSIPSVNISWFYGNKSITNKIFGNRFFILQNGSLLINHVTENDKGKYKCVARNHFSTKEQRQFTTTLLVNSSLIRNNIQLTGLLSPPLQNQTQYVKFGKTLKLHCASYSETIEWSFKSKFHLNSIQLINNNNSNEIVIRNAAIKDHEGEYKCSTKTDYQIFDVIVTTPPIIENELTSLETSLAASVSFTCNATGNPPPTITWYRNGRILHNSLTVQYNAPTLRINSFDIEDEGIYQCFAKNLVGETVTTGLLNLRRKDDLVNMPKRPQNIKCFPVNYKTLYVTFDSTPSLLFMMNLNIVTENPFKWNSTLPIRLHSNSSILITDNLPILKPFVLFMRGLVTTSTQSLNGFKEHTFDVSLLSDGIKCATQGLGIKAIFMSNGIFIWWTPVQGFNPKQYSIQFWNNDTASLTKFQEEIVGYVEPINIYQQAHDIQQKLHKIPASIKTYTADNIIRKKRSMMLLPKRKNLIEPKIYNYDKSRRRKFARRDIEESITEVLVHGNVTGMLIPNTQKITVRVLMTTDANEDLDLDLRYVEWKTIENITDHDFVFRIAKTESRSITIAWNPFETLACIKTCYNNLNHIDIILYRQEQEELCQEINSTDTYFIVRKLKPSTNYRMDFMDCKSLKYFGGLEVQTKPDAPGPIYNHKLIKDDGLKLIWEPPINPNGQIIYYNFLWTFNNRTHEANVTSNEKSFKFPNVTENDKLNITVRAIGTTGIGFPIFIDLRNYETHTLEKENESTTTDHTLGIALGILLSLFCIIIFMWIFIKQRQHFKHRSHNHENRNLHNEQQHQQQQLHQQQFSPTTIPQNIELHEIQTLIQKPLTDNNIIQNGGNHQLLSTTNLRPISNGILYRNHHNNHTNNDTNENSDNNLTENHNDRRIYCSTPIIDRKRDLSERLLDENNIIISPSSSLYNVSMQQQQQQQQQQSQPSTINNHHNNEINHHNSKNSSSSNNSNNSNTKKRIHSNGNPKMASIGRKYQNGSIKTGLPLLKHSISANLNEQMPNLSHKMNGNLKMADNNTQYLTDPNYNTSSIFDNSHHKLLDENLDSSLKNNINDINNDKHHQKHNNLTNNHTNDNDFSDLTETTMVNMDDNSSDTLFNHHHHSNNSIQKSNWNYRRPIIDPNG